MTGLTFRARPRYVSRPRDIARCECCDHPLQHAIRDFLSTYENAVPPLRIGVVIGNLADALAQWEDADGSTTPSERGTSDG